MTREQKIIKIGNSSGIIIPAELKKELNAKTGDTVKITVQNGTISFEKSDQAVRPEFLQAADKVAKKYHRAFQELAKK